MKHSVATATQIKVQESSALAIKLLTITFRIAFILTLSVILLVGIWAIAALVGGTLEAGGIFGLVKSWFLSVTGI